MQQMWLTCTLFSIQNEGSSRSSKCGTSTEFTAVGGPSDSGAPLPAVENPDPTPAPLGPPLVSGGLDPLIPAPYAGLVTLFVGVLCVDPPSDAAGAAAFPRCARGVVIAAYGVAQPPARGGRSGTQPNRDRAAGFSGVRNWSLDGVGAGDSVFRFTPDDAGGAWMARSGGRDAASGPAAAAAPAIATTAGASPVGTFSSFPAPEGGALAGVRRCAPRSRTILRRNQRLKTSNPGVRC